MDLGKFQLQLGLPRPGVALEDLQDQVVAIHHQVVDEVLNISRLGGRQPVVEDQDYLGRLVEPFSFQGLERPGAGEVLPVGPRAAGEDFTDERVARRLHQAPRFPNIVPGSPGTLHLQE
ncbi:MAG: hypothetical protein Kow0069_32230 [Promethearchaeota archaeon]